MANKWLVHIKKTMKQMKAKGTYIAGKGLGQVIKAAKKTWHSTKKAVGLRGGGEDSDSDEDENKGPGKMRDVNLAGDAAAAAARAKEAKKAEAGESTSATGVLGALGGRHRKTRRRRRHSRRH
jgi:hypothetical protein